MKGKFLMFVAFWLHILFFVWIFGGLIPEFIWPSYVPVHTGLMVATLILQAMLKWQCPFTLWEKKILKEYAPEKLYEGSFLRHYAKLYFNIVIPRGWVLGAIVLTFLISLILLGINFFTGRWPTSI